MDKRITFEQAKLAKERGNSFEEALKYALTEKLTSI